MIVSVIESRVMSSKRKSSNRKLLDIIRNLHNIHDHSLLLERILHEARILVSADAGTLYIQDGDKLYFGFIENDTLFPEGQSEDKFTYTSRGIPVDKNSLAGFVAKTGRPLRIDDVYDLPRSLDFSFNPEFDRKTSYRSMSQLVIPMMGAENRNLGVIQLINARRGEDIVPFSDSDRVNVSFLADHAVLAMEKAEMARKMMMRMVRISELQEPLENANHARRVGEIALVLYDGFAASRGIGLAERNRKKEMFRAAAILHDIGKAGVPSEILANNGHYTQEEKMMMYRHTIYGARIFSDDDSPWDRIAREVTLNHHERWDGSGYPGKIEDLSVIPENYGPGKIGRDIPLSARIVAIADVYDALISERSYKEPWSAHAALQYIKSNAGKLFDPELVSIFLTKTDTLKAIRENLA